jgi:phosphotriesterase-related protein
VIQTVLGPVAASDWGVTAVHEHLFLDLSPLRGPYDTPLTNVDLVADEVHEFVLAGGQAIVEVSSNGMGRNVPALVDVSRRTGCHVVAATGFYTGPWLPPMVDTLNVHELADFMVHELSVGMTDDGVRAGLIAEIGTSQDRVLYGEEKVFRAAAIAQQQTGCPIMTHTAGGTMAREQVQLLEDAGADLSKVAIGHLDLRDDVEYHLEIARRGAFIQYDTIGKEQYQPDAVRLRLTLAIIERGYADHLMLACDISRSAYLRRCGGYGYQYLLTEFVPRLRAAGVDDATINTLLIENPRRFLAYQGGR